MDLTFSDEQDRLRASVREWLENHRPASPLPSMDTAEGFELHREWEQLLHRGGWSAVNWPRRYGGRDLGLIEWLIFEEEYYRADVPGRVNQNGIFMLGPTLLEHGTEEQCQRFLPPMAAGEEIWCQGWSEPEVGSDLASIRTRAERDGDDYVLNGQKIWVSRGTWADWMFGLFRTGEPAERHRTLTFLLVSLDAPGITVRPIEQMDGRTGFAEVFFDDVRVPVNQIVGAENEGWKIAMATAAFERGVLLRSPGRFMAAADRLVDLAIRLGATGRAWDAVTQCWIDAQAHRLHTYWTVSRVLEGEVVGAESSLNKLFWSELDLRIHETALGLLGEFGNLHRSAPSAVDEGRWLDGYLFALTGPIYAGTNQVQRNIVAERLLGLPRSA